MIPTIPALPLSHLESGGMTISVIVPAHNAAGYLRHSLPALQRSTYPAFECIVVDDASTDDTAAVCRAFAVQRVGLTGAPHGPATARNRGAAVSQGDILLFLDADVVLRPETLSRLAAAFQNETTVAAHLWLIRRSSPGHQLRVAGQEPAAPLHPSAGQA
ncbi:MAG: glycosyltransferase family 2 protein [Anaerolineae bacterium]|uniref:glycosyltransferase family 2 protein n=1 Tax=Candidatus Amarolinea dominans TaxID=3140696 RepID=UPI003134AA15|nr:glycosyltransferase family 2 protein [Anaerolineae bacterium]